MDNNEKPKIKPRLIPENERDKVSTNLGIKVKDGIAEVKDKADLPNIDRESLIRSGAILYKGIGIRDFDDERMPEFIAKLNKLLGDRQAIIARDHTQEELQINQEDIYELANLYTNKQTEEMLKVIDKAIKDEAAKPYAKLSSGKEMIAIYSAAGAKKTTTADDTLSTKEFFDIKATFSWPNGGISDEGWRLFMFGIEKRCKSKSNIISFTLQEWNDRRKLKRKIRSEDINKQLKLLYEAQVYLDNKTNPRWIRIITTLADTTKDKGVKTTFQFELHNDIVKVMEANTAYAYLYKEFYETNDKKNPYSAMLLLCISLHYGLQGRPTRIPIERLLKATDLPTEKDVKTKLGRNYKEKIIKPFERDMNALKSITWKYEKGDGKSWDKFKTGSISYKWNDQHPQETIGAGMTEQVCKNDGTGMQE